MQVKINLLLTDCGKGLPPFKATRGKRISEAMEGGEVCNMNLRETDEDRKHLRLKRNKTSK
jgi:hypothetical protein